MSETVAAMGRRMIAKKARMVALKAEAEQAEADYREEERAFWDRMDDEGDTARTLDLGAPYGRVQFQKRETIRGRVLDKDRAIASIENAGLQETLLEPNKVRQGALNDLMRRWVRTGEEIPEGLDFSATRYVTITPKKTDKGD